MRVRHLMRFSSGLARKWSLFRAGTRKTRYCPTIRTRSGAFGRICPDFARTHRATELARAPPRWVVPHVCIDGVNSTRAGSSEIWERVGRASRGAGASAAAGAALVAAHAAAHALLDGDHFLARSSTCERREIERNARSAVRVPHGFEAQESLQMYPKRAAHARFVGSYRAPVAPAMDVKEHDHDVSVIMRKSPESTTRARAQGRGASRPISW